jgi:hypothetical protein
MINLTPDARLSIILPNTNKALSEAIKNATPAQLEQLKEGKDIKSLLTSVFQDKITASKSDQTLLDLLKNSSAFKNMGSFTDELKSLLRELKSSPDLAPKTAALETFNKNAATLDPQSLKSQIANSGVFMESKFAAVLQKIPDLTQTLEQLRSALTKNPSVESKTLQGGITTLLESGVLTKAATHQPSALGLADNLKQLSNSLQQLLSKTDVLYSKEITQLAQKLDQLTAVQEIKSTLSQIYGALLPSSAPETNSLLDSIEKLLKNLNTASPKEVKEFTRELRSAISEGNITQEVSAKILKLGEFLNPKELVSETFLRESMSNDMKSNLLSLSDELKQSNDPNAPKLLEHVDKLLTQIDYHQLVSHLSSSNSIYLPFAWDQLQEGSLAFKKTADKKFYCEINLQLKEYGELNLMMALYDGNQLDIQAHSEKPELKELLQEHIGELRGLLIDAGMTLRSIRVFEMRESVSTKSENYEISSDGYDLGFEVKV